MSVGSTAHLLGNSLIKDGLVGDFELGADVPAVRLTIAAAAGIVKVELGGVENLIAVTAPTDMMSEHVSFNGCKDEYHLPVGLSTSVLLGLVRNVDMSGVLAKVAGEGVTSGKGLVGRPMDRIIGLVRAGHDWRCERVLFEW